MTAQRYDELNAEGANSSAHICYSIGHSNLDTLQFLALLKENSIETVVDVRSIPYSRRHPQFIRKNLEPSLNEAGIDYVFLGDELGARGKGPELMFPSGMTVDFAKVRQTEDFKQGMSKLAALVWQGGRVAMMCAERDPYNCHRFTLVAYSLEREKMISVRHIIEHDVVISNESLEKRLLDQYVGESLGLFSEFANLGEALISAYEKKNMGLKR
jgi:uncharacterized protein (DUF488 family)